MLILTLVVLTVTIVTALMMRTPTQAVMYGMLSGLASGHYRVIDAVVWPKYYGRLHLGAIRGFTMIAVLGSTALGPYPPGLSLDYFGSYTPGLLAMLPLPVGIGIVTFFVKRPEKQWGRLETGD